MIVASLTRMSLGKPGWSYLDFDGMEYFLDWLIENPEKECAVAHVHEFKAGVPVEIPASDWGSQLAEIQGSARADIRHAREWGRPGL